MIPLGQITGELRDTREWTAQIGSVNPVISNAKARTGAYSLQYAANTASVGLTFTAQNGLRCGAWLNHNLPSGSFTAPIFRLRQNTTEIVRIQWVGNGNLQMLINNNIVAQISPQAAGIAQTDVWLHIGLAYIANQTVTFYLNGLPILSNAAPNTPINETYIGGNYWNNYAYFDDFYVDGDITADAAPPAERFLFSLVNGPGDSTQWTPVGAAANWQCVNQAVPDDDTTYISSNAANQLDLYNTADITLPTGYQIRGVIPIALARVTAVGPQLQLVAAVDAAQSTSDAKTLGTTYRYLWHYFAADPNGQPWTQSTFNNAQFGVRSTGSFS